jgi:hypothetical protein
MGILFNFNSSERPLLFRLIMLLGWSIVIVLVTNALIIIVVALHSSAILLLSGAIDPQLAFNAGYKARIDFFSSYGDYIKIGQGILIILLALMGKLPLTTKSG